MKISNGILAAAVVAGLSLSGLSAQAAGPGGPGGWGGGMGAGSTFGGPAGNALDGLDLTRKQRNQIATILKEAHDQDQAQDTQEEFENLHAQIEDLLSAPGPLDQDQIAQVQQKMATLRAEREARHLQTASRIHDVLTTDQLAQMRQRQKRIHELLNELSALQHPAQQVSSDSQKK
ncbi:periplasmic heavy metal sensor [Acetobacter sp. LMG 32666]|uniref:Spy/CpxP family protein refolding chaperone n=1 Tax=Acetobacter sp. LMG 32666 TaxID=2959295 RepID=UPI0030C8D3D8